MLESTLNKIVLLAALGKEQEMKRVKSTLLCFVQIVGLPSRLQHQGQATVLSPHALLLIFQLSSFNMKLLASSPAYFKRLSICASC